MKKIIGESSSLMHTLNKVSLLAPLNRPVLVIGERGAGKELIADRLHYLSNRWDQDFQKVNCAAISENLLESELFGHEAGAFTGANKSHIGRFERVNGGTLFLDELGTLPLRIQEKLLRVVEYGEFERLGGQKTLTVDIRIIGATNDDLPKAVAEGRFRGDLLDRLAFDVVRVPPLRERCDDIAELADHFAARMALELGWEYYSGFTRDALHILETYHWPGNIRELRNVIERSLCHWAVPDSPVDEIILNPFDSEDHQKYEEKALQQDLPVQTQNTVKNDVVNNEKTVMINEDIQLSETLFSQGFKAALTAFESGLIQKALQDSHFKQKAAAEKLKITYHQFRNLFKKHKTTLDNE